MKPSTPGTTRTLQSRNLAVAGICAVALLLAVTGCGRDANLTFVGTVADDTIGVAVPTLNPVAVNPDAGFAPDPMATPAAGKPRMSAVAAVTSLGSFTQIAQMTVSPGDQVTAGQTVATLEHSQQSAQLAVAKADAAVAGALPGVLSAAIDKTYDKAATISDKRAQVVTGIHELNTMHSKLLKSQRTLVDSKTKLAKQKSKVLNARSQLGKKRAKVLAQRSALTKQVRALKGQLALLPPGPSPAREQLTAAIAKLEGILGQVNAGLRKMNAGLAKMNAGIAKMDTGLRKINAGLSKITNALPTIAGNLATARDGIVKLDDAAHKIRDARAILQRRRDQARIAAKAASLTVDTAREQLARTKVSAPASGLVVSAANAGDVLAPGATLLTIRPDDPPTVTTWLAPDELARVCLDGSASLRGDWMAEGEALPATLTRIGTRWDYPPSSQATDEVHLTRALPVQFTAKSGDLPAGVPVEITVDACTHASAPSPDQSNS